MNGRVWPWALAGPLGSEPRPRGRSWAASGALCRVPAHRAHGSPQEATGAHGSPRELQGEKEELRPLLSLPSPWLTRTAPLLQIWEVPMSDVAKDACPGPPLPLQGLTLLPSHEDLSLTFTIKTDGLLVPAKA